MMEDMEFDIKHERLWKKRIINVLEDLAAEVADDLDNCDSDDIMAISNYATTAKADLQQNKAAWTKDVFNTKAIEHIQELLIKIRRVDPTEFVCEIDVDSPLNTQGKLCLHFISSLSVLENYPLISRDSFCLPGQ